ncbi:MAG TPA: hypothetical protein VMV68_09275 [Spirochaetia bacterium]|nr:hypothetical protein [Spirochaetia bacterium]
MGSTSRRVNGVSFLCYLGAYFAIVVYSIITFEPKNVLSSLLWSWVWTNSAVILIQAIVPIQATALLIVYSFTRLEHSRKAGAPVYEPFYRLVNSVLVTLLVYTLIFTAVTEGLLPVVQGAREALIERTLLAHAYYADYETALREKRYADAQSNLQRYLDVNPSNASAHALYDKLSLANIQRNLATAAAESSGLPAAEQARVENESTSSLIALAQAFMTKGDYASANYYASVALTISPASAAARQILSRSQADLSRVTPSAAEQAQKAYFAKKSLGRQDLENGNPIRAYYLFKSLEKKHADDPDVTTYLSKSLASLSAFAFFRQEIDRVDAYPGTRDVLFVERERGGAKDVVYFHKMVTVGDTTYVNGIEAIQLSPSGSVTYQVHAPYGKMIGNNLSMYCIEKDKELSYLPQVISGTFPDTQHYQLPVTTGIGTLQQLGGRAVEVSTSSLPRLFSLVGLLPSIGYLEQPIQVDMLRRVLVPFSFLILSIFSIGAGWSLRVRSGHPSPFAYLIVPFFPFVVSFLYSLYLYGSKIFYGFLLTLIRFWPTLIVLAGVQFVLLILSLVYLAGQSTEE